MWACVCRCVAVGVLEFVCVCGRVGVGSVAVGVLVIGVQHLVAAYAYVCGGLYDWMFVGVYVCVERRGGRAGEWRESS